MKKCQVQEFTVVVLMVVVVLDVFEHARHPLFYLSVLILALTGKVIVSHMEKPADKDSSAPYN
jgi:hypothetical protein